MLVAATILLIRTI